MATQDEAHKLLMQMQRYGKDRNVDAFRAAFTELYEKYYPNCYSFARGSQLTHEQAEELTQETFERILKKFEQYDETRSGGIGWRWIWKIHSNNIRQWLRAHRREGYGFRLTEEIGMREPKSSQEETFEQKEYLLVILAAFTPLSEEERKLLEPKRGRKTAEEKKAREEIKKRVLATINTLYYGTKDSSE